MYELVTLEKDKFENFVSTHNKSHFLQSTDWGEFAQKEKGLTPFYLGLTKEDKVVAATLLLKKNLPLGYSYFYAPRGFVLDYNDKEVIKEMTQKTV